MIPMILHFMCLTLVGIEEETLAKPARYRNLSEAEGVVAWLILEMVKAR